MAARHVKLIDPSRQVLAVGQGVVNHDRFEGQVDARALSPSLYRIFQEYEEIVNGQIFSLLDEMEERIRALGIKAVLDGGDEARIEDLQLYPSTGLISFKIAPSTLAASSGSV